jgi:hypothetical protein
LKSLGVVVVLLATALPAGGASTQLGAFKPAGALRTARSLHTATRLPDGRVLVVGGRGIEGTVELDSVELYEPKSGRWSLGPPLSVGRSGHTATLLPDGRVLIAGGTIYEASSEGGRFIAVATVELFDPKANQWKPGAPMHQARNWHTATLLEDGRVLVVGGAREQKSHLASAEYYQPSDDAWVSAPSLSQSRCLHQAVRLTDGSVLVVGGRSNQVPAEGQAPDAVQAQRPHGASTSASGFGMPIASAERWVADAGWALLPEPVDPRQRHALVALSDARALVVGGATRTGLTNLAELWTPDAGAWLQPEHSLSMGLGSHTATALPSGGILVIGGEPPNSVDTRSAQIFEMSEQRWCQAGELKSSRKQHTATLLADGKVLVTGGVSAGISERTAELWEPRKGKCEEPLAPSFEW